MLIKPPSTSLTYSAFHVNETAIKKKSQKSSSGQSFWRVGRQPLMSEGLVLLPTSNFWPQLSASAHPARQQGTAESLALCHLCGWPSLPPWSSAGHSPGHYRHLESDSTVSTVFLRCSAFALSFSHFHSLSAPPPHLFLLFFFPSSSLPLNSNNESN